MANQVTEWVIPGSLPAAFHKASDGTYWVPITGAALLNVNFETGTTTSYRSALTYAYADMAVAPDGTLWLADFGNNRIVRYVPGAETETSWTFFNPGDGRLNPTQIDFDDQGISGSPSSPPDGSTASTRRPETSTRSTASATPSTSNSSRAGPT